MELLITDITMSIIGIRGALLDSNAYDLARSAIYLAVTKVFTSLPPLEVLCACAKAEDEKPFYEWYKFTDEHWDQGPSLVSRFGPHGHSAFELTTPTSQRKVTISFVRDGEEMNEVAIAFGGSQRAATRLVEVLQQEIYQSASGSGLSGEKLDILMDESKKTVRVTGFCPQGQFWCDVTSLALEGTERETSLARVGSEWPELRTWAEK